MTTTNPQATDRVAAAMQAASAVPQKAQAEQVVSTLSQRVRNQNSLAGLTQNEVGQYLAGMRDRVAQVLPKHLTADRILQMAATTIARNPKIAECSAASLLGGVMQASILGFPPVDALGYCYFVPYGKDVQFQIGYKGLLELARRSGKIKMVYAEVVRKGDDFSFKQGLYPDLQHTPKLNPDAEITHAYAVCHFEDGGYNFVVLSRAEVERLRMRSPMQKGKTPAGAWATDYEAMAKAKALKQLAKYLPLNIDQATAIAADEAVLTPDNFSDGTVKAEDIVYADVVEVESSEVQNAASEVQNSAPVNTLL